MRKHNQGLEGRIVRVIDGPFTGFRGEVKEVDEQTVKVDVQTFGRVTPWTWRLGRSNWCQEIQTDPLPRHDETALRPSTPSRSIGDDLRDLPLSMGKANLQRLLARRPDGIFLSNFKQGEIGPDLFRAACRMGLEGLVSKHCDRPYRGGRQKHWIKVKNRKHPAIDRVLESFR